MNKQEKAIFSNQYFSIYSSPIAQYLDTTNNINYLIFANKDKNFIYIQRGTLPISTANVTIGDYSIQNLKSDENGIFLDVSDVMKAQGTGISDLSIYVSTPGPNYTYTAKIIIMYGYNFDRLALQLSSVQLTSCQRSLANYIYTDKNSNSYVSPPTYIIIPIEEGRRKYRNVEKITLPQYQQYHGNSNSQIRQVGVGKVGTSANQLGFINIDIDSIRGNYAYYIVAGTLVNNIIFRNFEGNKKYVAVRWTNPYTNSTYIDAQGDGSPSIRVQKDYLTCFFEVFNYEVENIITELESTANYMPYLVEQSIRCTIGIKNIPAYDYVYYSQILLSENVEVLFNEDITNTSTRYFRPARLEKSKINIPIKSSEMYDLELTLIIEKGND